MQNEEEAARFREILHSQETGSLPTPHYILTSKMLPQALESTIGIQRERLVERKRIIKLQRLV